MAQLDPAVIVKRSEAAWRLRDMWRHILMDAYELAFAGINPYAGNKDAPRAMNRQFASTAIQAVVKLANRILNEWTPPHQNWIEVAVGPILEMQIGKEAAEQLEPHLANMSKIGNMVINGGQSVNARARAFLDEVISGMGCILCLDDATDDIDPMIDQCVSQSEVAIEEDAKDRICGIYRKRKIKIREILDVWDDAKIPAELNKHSGQDKDPEIEVLEATYSSKTGGKKIWHYEVLYTKSGKDPVRIVEREYEISPWTIFRWMKLPGIPYGPGPVLLSLADIRTENKVMEMMLQHAALALAGMWLVRDDGVINPDNITITPGGMITVQSTGGPLGASMAPLETNREFDVGEIMKRQLSEAIKKQLYDTSLPPDRATPASATEIIQRIKEYSQDLGIGSGQKEQDIIQYVRTRMQLLQRRGFIPPFTIDQLALKIQINSPLARAAKLSEIETVINWYQTILSLGGPQSAVIIGAIERIALWMAKGMGVPRELTRQDDEQKQLKQDVVAMVAQQTAAPKMAQAA